MRSKIGIKIWDYRWFAFTSFAFLFRKKKYVKEKKQLVQDLIPPLNIYIHMCTLYTYTNICMSSGIPLIPIAHSILRCFGAKHQCFSQSLQCTFHWYVRSGPPLLVLFSETFFLSSIYRPSHSCRLCRLRPPHIRPALVLCSGVAFSKVLCVKKEGQKRLNFARLRGHMKDDREAESWPTKRGEGFTESKLNKTPTCPILIFIKTPPHF